MNGVHTTRLYEIVEDALVLGKRGAVRNGENAIPDRHTPEYESSSLRTASFDTLKLLLCEHEHWWNVGVEEGFCFDLSHP